MRRAKTKKELKAELVELRDAYTAIEYMQFLCVQIQEAVAYASRCVCSETGEYPNHKIAAFFMTVFYAELQRLTGVDTVELADGFLLDSGFDECTATIIKQSIPEYLEIFILGSEGRSDEEIIEYRCQQREREKQE